MFKSIFVTAIFLGALTASAGGHETGNGGDAVVCYNQPLNPDGTPKDPTKPVEIVKVELLDFWEWSQSSTIKYNPELLLLPTEVQIVNAIIARSSQINDYFGWILKTGYEYYKSSSVYIKRVAIKDINDAYVPYFLENNCYIRQMARQVKDPKYGEAKYQIDADLYSRLTTHEKAGLILHELLYNIAITHDLATNSDGVRYMNYILFSSDYPAMNSATLSAVLYNSGLKLFSKSFVLYGRTFTDGMEKYHLGNSIRLKDGVKNGTVTDDGNLIQFSKDTQIVFMNDDSRRYYNPGYGSVFHNPGQTITVFSCKQYDYFYLQAGGRLQANHQECTVESTRDDDEVSSHFVGKWDAGRMDLTRQFSNVSDEYFIKYKKLGTKLTVVPFKNPANYWAYMIAPDAALSYGRFIFSRVKLNYAIDGLGSVSIDLKENNPNQYEAMVDLLKTGENYFTVRGRQSLVQIDLGKGSERVQANVDQFKFNGEMTSHLFEMHMNLESTSGLQIGNYKYEFSDDINYVEFRPNSMWSGDPSYLVLRHGIQNEQIGPVYVTNTLNGKKVKIKREKWSDKINLSRDAARFPELD